MPFTFEVPIPSAGADLENIARKAAQLRARFIFTNDEGEPVAVIVPMDDYADLVEIIDAEVEARVAKGLEEADGPDAYIDAEELYDELGLNDEQPRRAAGGAG